MSKIVISNHGALIASTNYWGSAVERAGKCFLSSNAGAIRVLVPRVHRRMIKEMRTATYVICSRGPWPLAGAADAVELLFEDGTTEPFSLHLTQDSCDFLPGQPEMDQDWMVSVWDYNGGPHKALERKCYWRRVENLPCLLPWKSSKPSEQNKVLSLHHVQSDDGTSEVTEQRLALMQPDLRMRRADLYEHFQPCLWPDPDYPAVYLDKELPQLEEASDAYAAEAIKGNAHFRLCGVDCDAVVINAGGTNYLAVIKKRNR